MGTTGQSVTLANSIIGVGILAMPFCYQQCGVILATLILLSMGLVSRLCCYFLLKAAIITRRRNYEFLAFHVFGSPGKMAVEVGIIGFLMGTCIAYFVVVGDLGPQIISKMFNINQSDILRTSIMVIVSLVCVLPLGLLRNVDSLSNVSAATISFYFCLAFKVIMESISQMLHLDWKTRINLWRPSGLLQCVPIFSMALFCQTQLFEIFESMPSLSLEKMNLVTKTAIDICISVYFTLGLFGYIAFSSQDISGNVLMSLRPTIVSDFLKLGFVMSVACSFPLVIFPCRASLYSFLYRKAHPSHHDHIINHSIPESTFRCITVAIVAVSLIISLLLPNVELVLGLVGSTIGVLVCVVFPAACFINVTHKNTNERVLAKFTVVLGLIILVLGTYANLQAAENTRDKYDEKYITQEKIDKMVEDFFQKMEKTEDIPKHPIIEPKKDENINGEKDSVALPPNPIPPESQSNEKSPKKNPEDKKDIIPDDKEKEVNNKLSDEQHSHDEQHLHYEQHLHDEQHSHDEQNLRDEQHSHDEQVIQEAQNGQAKNNLVNSQIVNKIKENVEEKLKSHQEKIDMMKHQQLMETIKQHGQEQKELIKEQKEILNELRKTKDEIKKNKKDVDNEEAKKIAVESIQKIANVAIQSLTGDSDKSIGVGDKKSENSIKIEKSESLNEIVKKAAESLEGIKKIDDVKQQDKILDNVKIGNKDSKPVEKPKPVVNMNATEPILNGIVNNIQTESDSNKKRNPPSLPDNNKNQVELNQINSEKLDSVKDTKIDDIPKHTHLADEPKSYQQGEEHQKPARVLNTIGNVPLAIALSERSKIKQKQKSIDIQPKVENTKGQNEANLNKDNNGEVLVQRQKREVVDCTEKTSLKQEDKQICENLINTPDIKKQSDDFLPKVNLNDVLSNSLPLQALDMHHLRSLKSYEEKEKA